MNLPATLRPLWRELGRDLAVVVYLLMAATFLGVVFNHVRRDPLPWVYATKKDRIFLSTIRLGPWPVPEATTPGPASEPEMIDLARFHDLLDNGTLVLDARPNLFYRAGHVPGAKGLSRAAFEQDYARLRPILEPRRRETLAIYCAGDECEDSRLVASALQKLGYTRVLIFAGGWEEWRQAGLPEERSQ